MSFTGLIVLASIVATAVRSDDPTSENAANGGASGANTIMVHP